MRCKDHTCLSLLDIPEKKSYFDNSARVKCKRVKSKKKKHIYLRFTFQLRNLLRGQNQKTRINVEDKAKTVPTPADSKLISLFSKLVSKFEDPSGMKLHLLGNRVAHQSE